MSQSEQRLRALLTAEGSGWVDLWEKKKWKQKEEGDTLSHSVSSVYPIGLPLQGLFKKWRIDSQGFSYSLFALIYNSIPIEIKIESLS